MFFNYDENILSLLTNHLIVLVVFFTIYYSLYNSNASEHFSVNVGNNKMELVDVIYFTTTTHSSTGYGDYTAKVK